jgi:RND family efflux transporter MFP subunit
MKKKSIIISAVTVALSGVMIWTLAGNKKEIDSKKEVKVVSQEIAVTVAPAKIKTMDSNLQLVGTAEASRIVTVASETAGKITHLNFKLGDYVNKGDVLAQVDDTYKRLALENALLSYNKYREDCERYQVLRQGDAVTDVQLRDMKLAFENAAIQLENTKEQLNDTRIVAPFSGYIHSKNVELGAHVNVASAIAGMVDISELKITLSVSESNAYSLRRGQTVEVTTPIHPQARYEGVISNISPKGDNAHTYPVEIMIPNSREYPLKAGTSVNVQIKMDTSPVLTIPRNALVSSVKDPAVYLVKNDIVQLVKITVGRNSGSYLEILEGVRENDLVVTNGQINLTDKAKVAVINN